MLKSLLKPLIETVINDKPTRIKAELKQLWKKYVITQVDKDGSGIAFVCKKVCHKLAKRFIYGPNPKVSGLFKLDARPLASVIEAINQY